MVRATHGPALWRQVPWGAGRGDLALEALVTPKGAAATRRSPLCAGGPSLVISTPCPGQGGVGLNPLQVSFSSLPSCPPPTPRSGLGVALEWIGPLLLFAGKSSGGEVAGFPHYTAPVSLDWAARDPPPVRPHALLPSCPSFVFGKTVL